MAAKPFPILFITASRLGDAILSSGLVKTLADEAPGARFTIAGSALTAPLFAEVPGLEALIVMEKKPAGRHWIDLWLRIRRRHWALVVDLRGSALSGFLRRSLGTVRKVRGPEVHKVVEAARLLKVDGPPPPPYLFTSPEIEDRGESLTLGRGPILAVAPAANWVGKTWPAERFALAARQLLGEGGPMAGGRLMVLGGPEDQEFAEPVMAVVPAARRIDMVGREELLVCYAALKRVDLFIGNDSGLMHLAAAAGARTVGVFGPSNEILYAPWGPRCRTVRGERSFEDFRAADRSLSGKICHMVDLPVERVLTAAQALLAETQPEDMSARDL
ncbi:MAG TPA: glycosyltransferase family 9 protein [Caulobacteraceae bacterium]